MDVKSGTALITITMVLGVLMDGIDGSLVNVALPSIAYSFGTDTSVVSWVTISYYLTMAGFLLPFGRVASAGHIRRVFRHFLIIDDGGRAGNPLYLRLCAIGLRRLLRNQRHFFLKQLSVRPVHGAHRSFQFCCFRNHIPGIARFYPGDADQRRMEGVRVSRHNGLQSLHHCAGGGNGIHPVVRMRAVAAHSFYGDHKPVHRGGHRALPQADDAGFIGGIRMQPPEKFHIVAHIRFQKRIFTVPASSSFLS